MRSFAPLRPPPRGSLYNSRSSPFCGRRRCGCVWLCCCGCCFSSKTVQVFLKLFLLCVASCSWSLLIISLSLSTSNQPGKRVIADKDLKSVKEKREMEPCVLCRTQSDGPSKAFVRTFHRPLKQILNSVNKLDVPLVSTDLRIHLAILRVILVQLLKTIKLPTPPDGTLVKNSGTDVRKQNKNKPILLEARDILTVVDGMKSPKNLACPDHFLGTLAGYPRYNKGFVLHKCSPARLNETLSVILWDVDHSELMKHWTREKLSVYLITNSTQQYGKNTDFHIVPSYPSIEKTIRRILRVFSTPYVLLAPRLYNIRKDINFNRLIYVAEKTKVLAVSGSVRAEENGKWRSGCQVFTEDNGQMTFTRGYTASMLECQLCHFADGPLLIRTEWAINSGWPFDHSHPKFLMPSLFFHLGGDAVPYEHPILVCPDVMFRYPSLNVPWDGSSRKLELEKTTHILLDLWKDLARRRNLTQITLASGIRLSYPCHFFKKGSSNLQPALDTTKTDTANTYMEKSFLLQQVQRSQPAKDCRLFELEYILSRVVKSCNEIKLNCSLEGNITYALLYTWDPLWLIQTQSNRPLISIEADCGPGSLTLLREMIRTQDLQNLRKDFEALLIDGNFWQIRIYPRREFEDGHSVYRRIRVTESLWMLSKFSTNIINNSKSLFSFFSNSKTSFPTSSTHVRLPQQSLLRLSQQKSKAVTLHPSSTGTSLCRDFDDDDENVFFVQDFLNN